jgi:hypothetical protein
MRNRYYILVGKFKNINHRRPSRRWVDNIEKNLREMGVREYTDRTAMDRVQWLSKYEDSNESSGSIKVVSS